MIISEDLITHGEDIGTAAWEIGLIYKVGASRPEFGTVRQLGAPGFSGAKIALTSHNVVVCNSQHRKEQKKSAAYWCKHLQDIWTTPSLDAHLLTELHQLEMTKANLNTYSLCFQIHEDVLRDVYFKVIGDSGHLSVSVDGHDPESIGIITPEYEGLAVVRRMVIEHYESWNNASKTMCTSSMHWKSGNGAITLRDKLCLDAEKQCYRCAKRSFDAMNSTPIPDKEGGFTSLPEKTPPKIFSPAFQVSSGQIDQSNGGPATTTRSRRTTSLGIETFDGTGWVLTIPSGNTGVASSSAPFISNVTFNLPNVFESKTDETEWSGFLNSWRSP